MYDDNSEHEELLELAGRAEFAARIHDHAALLATTRRFLTKLAIHLDNERNEQRSLDRAAREYRARDEQELVEEFVNLAEVAAHSDGRCRCGALARKALRRLRHQIEIEAAHGM